MVKPTITDGPRGAPSAVLLPLLRHGRHEPAVLRGVPARPRLHGRADRHRPDAAVARGPGGRDLVGELGRPAGRPGASAPARGARRGLRRRAAPVRPFAARDRRRAPRAGARRARGGAARRLRHARVVARAPRRPPTRGIRLFGSLGFIAVALLVGTTLAARGDRPGDVLVPPTIALCVAGYALVARTSRRRPRTPARARAWATCARLARDRRLLLFLGACALHWAACAPYHLFFGVLVRDRGLPSDVTGLGMGAGVVAEIGALLLFPPPRAAPLAAPPPRRSRSSAARSAGSSSRARSRPAQSSRSSSCTASPSGCSGGRRWTRWRRSCRRGSARPARRSSPRSSSAWGTPSATSSPARATTGYRSAAPLFAWAAVVEVAALAFALLFLGRRGAATPNGPARAEAPGSST